MSKRRSRGRFRLLLYGRVIGRHRWPVTLLAVLLLVLWYPVSIGALNWPQPPADDWLLGGGLASTAYALFVWFGPRVAYAQPRKDHLRLETPIYRLKISYRRIDNTRPIDFARMFSPKAMSRPNRKLLEPFFGMTALGVDLRSYPLPTRLLRLFFNRFAFATDRPGLVLLVDDWMALSNQLTSMMEAWRAAREARPIGSGSDAAAILKARKKRRWR